jgi:hypothetical protein
MKKIYPILTFIFAIYIFNNCEKGKSNSLPIQIITDKLNYSTTENIKIELINNSDSIAYYFNCSSYKGIAPSFYKLENNSWTGYWAPLCNGYSSYCCSKLQPGDSYHDTLNIALEKGTFRIEYQFVIGPSHEYESFFSSSIKVE